MIKYFSLLPDTIGNKCCLGLTWKSKDFQKKKKKNFVENGEAGNTGLATNFRGFAHTDLALHQASPLKNSEMRDSIACRGSPFYNS